jgi:hypothetical protein
MYKGTLIKDLTAIVARAEQGAQQKKIAEERELKRMFALQTPQIQQSERIYAGAA